ncbi:MAG: hypothetical protein WBH44_01790 [Proteocatella sp.]
MKNMLYVVIGLIVLIIEIAIANKFPIFGGTVDLLLIYTIILSRKTDVKTNFIVVVTLGFIKDILIGLKFGVNIAILVMVAMVIRFTKDKIYEYQYLYPIVMISMGTVIQCLSQAAVSAVYYNSFTIPAIMGLIVKKVLLNCAFGLLIYESTCSALDKI